MPMTTRQTTRRAILAGAATAVAVVQPGAVRIANAKPVELTVGRAAPAVAPDVSFPDLVARFIPLRRRLLDHIARWDAWSEAMDDAFYRATGAHTDEWRAIPHSVRQSDPLDIAHRKIEAEMPFDDPMDEHGSSIELNEISDELTPVVEAMIESVPRSLIDLAWQAEALMVWDSEINVDFDCPAWRLRQRLIRNVQGAAGPLPGIDGPAARSLAAATIAVVPVAAEQRLFEIEKEVGELGLKIKAVADEQDAFDGLICDQDVLFEEAVDIRPVTLGGIHCKARLARAWDPNHESMPTELADSLVDDLLALGVQS